MKRLDGGRDRDGEWRRGKKGKREEVRQGGENRKGRREETRKGGGRAHYRKYYTAQTPSITVCQHEDVVFSILRPCFAKLFNCKLNHNQP